MCDCPYEYYKHNDSSWASRITADNPYAVNLSHVNGDQLPLAGLSLGAEFFSGRYNIGHWAWELAELPESWLAGLRMVDEVWAPTEFVRAAVSRRAAVSTFLVPYVVEFDVLGDVGRRDFGLPPDKFLFLCMCDVMSVQERKNPEGAITAFQSAFPGRTDVALVVKVNNGHHAPKAIQALRQRSAGLPEVYVLDETLPGSMVRALEATCDAFLSLHRSEGFGLCLAECMYLGKPVVATHWSGNVDFMNDGNSCPVRYQLVKLPRDIGPYRRGQQWAQPDLDHAAWLMRRLVERPAWRAELGDAGRNTIRRQFSRLAVGKVMRDRLTAILGPQQPLRAA
jgi:glycosyltransferase involved in cell wall biosynthesis